MVELDCRGLPSNASKFDPRRYQSEEAAFERVDSLRQYGIWPGVVRYRDGSFGLTYDPMRAGVTLPRRTDY
jgi:hypothetical protein